MLSMRGYIGQVSSIGNVYSGIAVYGIYDEKIINYRDALEILDIEGHKQESDIY